MTKIKSLLPDGAYLLITAHKPGKIYIQLVKPGLVKAPTLELNPEVEPDRTWLRMLN